MKKYTTSCDMGSIKIFNDDMSTFFLNDIGDCPNIVEVYGAVEGKKKMEGKGNSEWTFLGHFTVKGKPAHLSDDDCYDNSVHMFNKGRWFVFLLAGSSKFRIILQDKEIHC
jgi:hypothetical protein